MKVNSRKVAVIGCGFVGSSSAFALMQSGLFSEMVLIDADTKRAEGEAMDISHGISFARPMQIYAGNYDDITDAAIIVITAGANQKPDETRLDLIKKNAAIMKSIVGEIKKRDFGVKNTQGTAYCKKHIRRKNCRDLENEISVSIGRSL